jgi:2-polyprenyl-6-methoxyphenol hydroxylase-like FAD-dependent oxidoreductase
LSLIYDVVIAGAGPVGLFLACELRLAGLSVLVLEQAEDPRSPLKRLPFGMRGLSAPTIEAFHPSRVAGRHRSAATREQRLG